MYLNTVVWNDEAWHVTSVYTLLCVGCSDSVCDSSIRVYTDAGVE